MSRGGFRKNAKRPLIYGEKTEVVKFSVPESKVEEVKKKVKAMLNKWRKPK